MAWIYDEHTSSAISGQEAAIKSPIQTVSGDQCVTFAYQNVNYDNMVPITLSMVARYDHEDPDQVDWRTQTSHGYKWTMVKVNLTAPSESSSSLSVKKHFFVSSKTSKYNSSFS